MTPQEQINFKDFIAENFDNHLLVSVADDNEWMRSDYGFALALKSSEGFESVKDCLMEYIKRGDWDGIAAHWSILIGLVGFLKTKNLVNTIIEKAKAEV